MFSTILFDAGRTQNGNPRRVFVTFKNGAIVAAYDEGYSGFKAIKDPAHFAAFAGVRIKTTPAEYRNLLKEGKS